MLGSYMQQWRMIFITPILVAGVTLCFAPDIPIKTRFAPYASRPVTLTQIHFLRQCSFLPNNERHFMVKARQIAGILNNDQDTDYDLDPDLPVPYRHHFAEPRCHGLIWMSFMVTGLYMSSLRAARLEI